MPIMKSNKNEILTDIIIDYDRWKKHPELDYAIRLAVEKTLQLTNNNNFDEISIYLTSDKTIIELNKKYRGLNNPTNILSFTSSEPHLGDLILSYEYINQELKTYKKKIKAHITHLIIHGVLHLLGFDHENDLAAMEMEEIEIEILRELEYPNPYEIK